MENTRKMPAQAGRFKCLFSFETNGSGSKTCKVRAIAITGDVFIHGGWADSENPEGRLLFDLSGFKTRKSPVAMKFNHGSTIIGEWNRFELVDGNLIAHGIIKSVRDDDLAADLIRKLEAQLPHEASIGFDDEVEVEFIGEGEICSANGGVFAGPLYCVRAFFVRELSIVDLGACPGTETVADTEAEQEPAHTFSATIRPKHQLSKETEQPTIEEKTEPETETVEAPAIETETVVEGEDKPTVDKTEAITTERLAELSTEFGAERAIQWFCIEKLDESTAKTKLCAELKTEVQQLRDTIGKMAAGTPQVDFIPSDDGKQFNESRINELVNSGMSRGQAEYILKNKR